MAHTASNHSLATGGTDIWRALGDRPAPVRIWTRAEDNDLLLAIAAGVTAEQIAIEIGRPVSQVLRRVKHLQRTGAITPSPVGYRIVHPSPLRRGAGGEA